MRDPRRDPLQENLRDPEDPSRRRSIRYLIGGAIAAACPIPASLFAATANKNLGGEQNKICHSVRDGATFKLPAPSAEHEIVIIGGGPSGLMSAYLLRDHDFLLLEKEPRFGGNAISEQWKGKWYSTGAAYQMDDDMEALCREIGMPIHRIRSIDAGIINDQVVPEFWGEGLWKSSYPESVKKNWAKFFKDMKALDLKANMEKLDTMTFSELLEPYGEEVKLFFDNFGPNNWGADTESTSAYIGADSANWGGGLLPDRFTWAGGLGRISLALEEALTKVAANKLHRETTVIEVRQSGSRVHVSYLENGELKTVSAKAAVIACPKFIAKKIVKGLDESHLSAMNDMRYEPYVVANVCFKQVVYNGSYDTNIPAPSPIVDFNVADWVDERDNKEVNRPHVLTCYVPRKEGDRSLLLQDEYVMDLGDQVVDHLDKWFPGSRAKVEEVHLYRRGHPMYVSAPGVMTKVAPKIRKPLGHFFFAHSDSEGGISEYSSALKASTRVSKEIVAVLGKDAARKTVPVAH